MEHEFIDEMFERLLVKEGRTYGDAISVIYRDRAFIILDLQRIENGYQLFRKRYPQAEENAFRKFVKEVVPEDFKKCQFLFKWK